MDHPNIVNFKDYWIDYQHEKEDDEKQQWHVLTEQHSDDEQEEDEDQGTQSLESLIDDLRTKNQNIQVRLVFITEYMNSGTLHDSINQKLQSSQTVNPNTFQRWCNQLLSAIGYLHECEPPIVHGNLENKSIFQHRNGALKIGAIVRHYISEEIHEKSDIDSDIDLARQNDIRDFGVIALGMLKPEYGRLDESQKTDWKVIRKFLKEVKKVEFRGFLKRCLRREPEDRPTAKMLLRDPALYKLKTLKMIAAHQYLDNVNVEGDDNSNYDMLNEPWKDTIMAQYNYRQKEDEDETFDSFYWSDLLKLRKSKHKEELEEKEGSNASRPQDLNLHKYLEDVRNGQHGMATASFKPPTALIPSDRQPDKVETPVENHDNDTNSQNNGANSIMTGSVHGEIPVTAANQPPQQQNGTLSDEPVEGERLASEIENPQPKSKYEPEVRLIKKCEIEIRKNNITQQAESISSQASDATPTEVNSTSPFTIEIKLTFQNRAERILNADISKDDKGIKIAKELVEYGFISFYDITEVSTVFNNAWQKAFGAQDLPQQHYLTEQKEQEKEENQLNQVSTQA